MSSLISSGGVNEVEAPAVLLEPCVAFVAVEHEPGICEACGWLEVDHAVDGAPDPAVEAIRAA